MEQAGITQWLFALRAGDGAAFDALLNLTYSELRRLARSHLQRERSNHTLNATALVHEGWLRLVQQRDQAFENRAHFYGAVSLAMRRVLVDHARRRAARKRHGERVTLTELDSYVGPAASVHDLLVIEAALDALSKVNERLVRVVECRVFAGFTITETADVLGISHTTVSEDWRFARAWLHRMLSAGSRQRAA